MNLSFGTRLRQRREEQQITISAIAAQTKINPTLLHGLERDDVSQWPEGIFRRAYIRAYASAIGLDPDAIAREFLELHPDSVVVLGAGVAVWPEQAAEREAPPSRHLKRLFTSAAAVVPAALRRPRTSAVPVNTLNAVNTVNATVSTVSPGRVTRPDPDLAAVARLCTRLGRVTERREVEALMAEAATLLDAIGLIVWCSNARATLLTPALMHGYGEDLRNRLTAIPITAENAVGVAYRSNDVCIVDGDGVTGAVAVPLLGPRRCLGVLALELATGIERRDSVRAFATILAAQLISAPLTILTRTSVPPREHHAVPPPVRAARSARAARGR